MLTSFRVHDVWRIRGPFDEVTEVIRDATYYKDWWIGVDDSSQEHVDTRGLFGSMWTRSKFKHVQHTKHVLAMRVTGDMSGWVSWRFAEDGEYTVIEYRQQLHFNEKWQRYVGLMMHPYLKLTSMVIMRRGRVGLKRYFAEREKAAGNR